MSVPSISIVIPAYKASQFLSDTIASVLRQTYSNWELVIVDDGSPDNTFQIAQDIASQDSRIRAFTKSNGGVATARNFGLTKILPDTEYVMLLDHDDLLESNAIEILLNALKLHPEFVAAHGLALRSARPGREAEILGGDRKQLIARGKKVKIIPCEQSEPTTFAVMAYDGCLCTPGMVLIRRQVMKEIGPFRQDLAPSDDFDFWIRLLLHGDFVFVNHVVIEWRQHEDNVSGNTDLMDQALSINRHHLAFLPELTPEQQQLVIWRYQRMYASIIRHNAIDRRKSAMKSLWRGEIDKSLSQFANTFRDISLYLYLKSTWKFVPDRGTFPMRYHETTQIMTKEGNSA